MNEVNILYYYTELLKKIPTLDKTIYMYLTLLNPKPKSTLNCNQHVVNSNPTTFDKTKQSFHITYNITSSAEELRA